MNSIPPHFLSPSDRLVTVPKGDSTGEPHKARWRRILRLVIFWRWLIAGGVIGGALLGGLVSLLTTPRYTATTELQIARETAQIVNLGATAHDVSIGDQEFYQTQYSLLRSQALAERVASDIGAPDSPDFFEIFGKRDKFFENAGASSRDRRREIAGKILLSHVTVVPMHGTSLVDIDATTPSPALSKDIARLWGQDFIAANLDRRQAAAVYARRFLGEQIADLRGKLDEAERRALQYATSQDMVDLTLPNNDQRTGGYDPAQARLLASEALVTMNAARVAATTERINAASRLAAVGDQPDASSDALAYRALGLLRKERADVAAQYDAAARQGPGDASARQLRARLDSLDTSIRAEGSRVRTALRQAYQGALGREQALSLQVNAIKESLAEQRKRSIQYAIYRREADSDRMLYEALLQRSKEIGVAAALESNNVTLVGAPRLPDRPSSPNIGVNLALFTLAGTLASVIAALLLNGIDRGINEPIDFEEKLVLPLLGVVPKPAVPEAANGGTAEMPFALAEAYLEIVANLALSSVPPEVPASIGVISTWTREGGTATAIALARTLARGRRKVVLVDANLRAPSLHLPFALENGPGLANLLAGDAKLDDVLRMTAIEGLSIIPAGDAPDFLVSNGLEQLLAELRTRFDHVIVDCPALDGHAEAPLIGAASAALVYVVAAGVAPVATIRMALRRLGDTRISGGIFTMYAPRIRQDGVLKLWKQA
ncbi:polysaccharide biosynthesis tyrosine autokinase [Gluconacetobacter aggeris]|uniref:Polysaccharide biosynthesis tyrosine autokinase n=1 Tax=Gluconacetobacter aggeris TaxID=1286186 RepID=A0A7W4IUA2_9PROT|nr:polysaccharide biosynthesis tyrosine autokinase [Gluconacetobacter aggeris]